MVVHRNGSAAVIAVRARCSNQCSSAAGRQQPHRASPSCTCRRAPCTVFLHSDQRLQLTPASPALRVRLLRTPPSAAAAVKAGEHHSVGAAVREPVFPPLGRGACCCEPLRRCRTLSSVVNVARLPQGERRAHCSPQVGSFCRPAAARCQRYAGLTRLRCPTLLQAQQQWPATLLPTRGRPTHRRQTTRHPRPVRGVRAARALLNGSPPRSGIGPACICAQ